MINVLLLIALFKQALAEKWGYIWGTAGIMWTQKRQDALNKTTADKYKQGRKYGKKWIGRMVADCSGLFRWAFRKLGSDIHHGSDTIYRQYCTSKGTLKKGKRTDGQYLKPGTAVFVWNGETYSHIGLYVGSGIVIEAAGTISGVCTSKVTAGKWTHWGELKGVDYTNCDDPVPDPVVNPEPEPVPSTEPAKTYPTLRKGSKGEVVRTLQRWLVDLGYDVGSCGVDGDFGTATEKAVKAFQKANGLTDDGVVGQKTWTAILTDPKPAPAVTYTVTVTGLTRSEADFLAANYPGAIVKEVS